MEKQRDNLQPEGKEESSERVLNGVEASQLSDNEFKTMVIWKVNEPNENLKNYMEATRNLLRTTSAWKRTVKLSMSQKNTISELKNTVEGIKSTLDEAQCWISKLE